MGARGILLGQVACCALMAAAILACAIGSMVLAETKVRIAIIKVRPVTVAPEPPAVFGVSPDRPVTVAPPPAAVFGISSDRPVTVAPEAPAESRVSPDWPHEPVERGVLKVRPLTAVPPPPAEARVLPDWPNGLVEEGRFRCAAASDVCAWKRIPGGR
jgi:hypothetical protein